MASYLLHVSDSQGNPKVYASANPDAPIQCRDTRKTFSTVRAGDVLKLRDPNGRGSYFEVVESVETR